MRNFIFILLMAIAIGVKAQVIEQVNSIDMETGVIYPAKNVEVVDTIDGFINWDEFGKFMMQEDGIVRTEYGAIRRARGQEQVESCNPQMQSTCL